MTGKSRRGVTFEIDQTEATRFRPFVSGYSKKGYFYIQGFCEMPPKLKIIKVISQEISAFENPFGRFLCLGSTCRIFGGRAQPSKILWAENISAKKFLSVCSFNHPFTNIRQTPNKYKRKLSLRKLKILIFIGLMLGSDSTAFKKKMHRLFFSTCDQG